jgi:hypothetical protein
MSNPGSESKVSSRRTAPTLRWSHWQLAEKPYRCGLLALLAVAAALVIMWLDGRWWVGPLTISVIFLTTWHVWLPISWEIGPRGIAQHVGPFWRSLAWHQVASVSLEDGQLVVRPDAPSYWIASLRTLRIPYPDDQEERLRMMVAEWRQMASDS